MYLRVGEWYVMYKEIEAVSVDGNFALIVRTVSGKEYRDSSREYHAEKVRKILTTMEGFSGERQAR